MQIILNNSVNYFCGQNLREIERKTQIENIGWIDSIFDYIVDLLCFDIKDHIANDVIYNYMERY